MPNPFVPLPYSCRSGEKPCGSPIATVRQSIPSVAWDDEVPFLPARGKLIATPKKRLDGNGGCSIGSRSKLHGPRSFTNASSPVPTIKPPGRCLPLSHRRRLGAFRFRYFDCVVLAKPISVSPTLKQAHRQVAVLRHKERRRRPRCTAPNNVESLGTK